MIRIAAATALAFAALAAPVLFDSVAEYPMLLVAGLALAWRFGQRIARAVQNAAADADLLAGEHRLPARESGIAEFDLLFDAQRRTGLRAPVA